MKEGQPLWAKILPVRLSKQERKVKNIVQNSEEPITADKIARILSQEEGGTEVRRSTPAVAIKRVNDKVGVQIITKTGRGYVDALKIPDEN